MVAGPGAPTWATPDTSTPGPRLDPGLEVELLDSRGNWAQVRCANGWEAWTDLRLLQERGVAASPAAKAAPIIARGRRRRSATGSLEVVAAGGGLLAVIGSLLPWYSGAGYSLSAWDLSMWALVAGTFTRAGPTAGLVTVLAVGAVLGVSVELPPWAYALFGSLATSPAMYAIGRWVLATGPKASLGIGPVLTLAGGILIQYVHFSAVKARRAVA